MVEVRLENISKYFDDIKAVDNVSFSVKEGELLTLLGPSGCGKSTTLRSIAGFYFPDKGKINQYFCTYTCPSPRHLVKFQNPKHIKL